MKFVVKRRYTEDDVRIIKRSIRRRLGRFEKVSKILKIRKCTDPNVGEAYLYLLAIQEGGEIDEKVIIEDRKIFSALTPKRFEIIEASNKFGPLSIRELAKRANRNYKNVYDDVFSLYRFFLINLVRSGREKYIVGKTEEVNIEV